MSFAQVENDLNKDALLFLHHKGMKHYDNKIDYATVIYYSFTQYSLKCGMGELGDRSIQQ